jgi:dTDP-4-amino-4,6-dideoxygalactose transaminase
LHTSSVSPVRLIDLQLIPSESGMLGVIQASRHLGFVPKRVYFLADLPENAVRGAHAHKRLRQCIVCLHGAVTLEVMKGEHHSTLRLSDYRQGALLEPGCWRDLRDFTEGAVVLVIASEEYDEGDYIRSFEAFRAWEAQSAAQVPYLDLSRLDDEIGVETRLAIDRVLSSGVLIGGPAAVAFEQAFADFCGASFAVGVGNGLDALALALKARGVGPGDEVIAPAHTFVATALAISSVGATPVLVDIEPDTGLMAVDLCRQAVTGRTRAIVPVHLYGHPVDMDPIMVLAQQHDLFVLEDAAQAHGARYKGRRCGSLGHAAAFSFYPTKNLGAAGDGGAVVTDDEDLGAQVRKLANYGASTKYRHELMGANSRLDPLQAAILWVKLPRLDGWNARRREMAELYHQALADVPGLVLPAQRPWADPVWHVFAVRAPGRRDALLAHLRDQGVGANVHYPIPVHLQPCYAGLWREGQFPEAEAFCRETLSLPLDPMHEISEIERAAAAVRRFFS